MKINGYELHPLVSEFPEMPADHFAELVEDIKANKGKLRDRIVIHEGKILDGRHRAQALEILGIPLSDGNSRDFFPEREGTPEAYVISKNFHRRHLTVGQRAGIVEKLYQDAQKSKGGRPPKSTDVAVGKTRGSATRAEENYGQVSQLAAEANVSPKAIQRARAKREGRVPQPQRERTMICLEDLVKEFGTDDCGIYEKGLITIAIGTSLKARTDIESLGWGLYEL